MPILQRLLNSRDFAELMAEEAISPRGEDRADLRSGLAASAIANLWIEKGQKYKPADFLLAAPEKQAPPVEITIAAWRAFAEAHGKVE